MVYFGSVFAQQSVKETKEHMLTHNTLISHVKGSSVCTVFFGFSHVAEPDVLLSLTRKLVCQKNQGVIFLIIGLPSFNQKLLVYRKSAKIVMCFD